MQTQCATVFMMCAVSLAGFPDSSIAQQETCLSSNETREAVADKRAISPTAALRAARTSASGETLRARLCVHNGDLIYWVTLLTRSGKVGRVMVNAADGQVLEVR
ncbi:MAG: hypothetical protein BGP06_15195 [Rhizobiales bacterium 65-9]|nr:hypothetical protein [Hyphomicrobiales bacterium]OJY37845.1 MAG: hypothetical protein BGP06_15195 [Rhizobiales bacterium 65-9]